MTTARTLIIGVAIALAGLFIGLGFARGHSGVRFVTVKGLAERSVDADLAIWPLRLVSASDNLGRAQAQIDADISRVRAFLAAQKLDTNAITLQGFSVSDAKTQQEYGQSAPLGSRFVIRQTLVVRSLHPARVLHASQHVGELVAAGVELSSGEEYGTGGPTFVFTGLNALKPAMIAEATERAREAADQFARDSHAALGGIREANQGVFEILPRDQAPGISEGSQIEKTVRVVSTIEYFLK